VLTAGASGTSGTLRRKAAAVTTTMVTPFKVYLSMFKTCQTDVDVGKCSCINRLDQKEEPFSDEPEKKTFSQLKVKNTSTIGINVQTLE
jgi:hypothetical protein